MHWGESEQTVAEILHQRIVTWFVKCCWYIIKSIGKMKCGNYNFKESCISVINNDNTSHNDDSSLCDVCLCFHKYSSCMQGVPNVLPPCLCPFSQTRYWNKTQNMSTVQSMFIISVPHFPTVCSFDTVLPA